VIDSVTGQAVREKGYAVAKQTFVPHLFALVRLQKVLPTPSYLSGVLVSDAVLLNEWLTCQLSTLLGPNFIVARSHLGFGVAGELGTTKARSVLFGDAAVDGLAPIFSVALFVPLQETKALCGDSLVELGAGDCLLLDSRVNTRLVGDASVPGLLMVFARPWFREPQAAPGSEPVVLSTVQYLRLPALLRKRLEWRFDRYLSQRHRLFVYELAERLPPFLGAPIKRKLRGWASSY
jgi:hypothetical protein